MYNERPVDERASNRYEQHMGSVTIEERHAYGACTRVREQMKSTKHIFSACMYLVKSQIERSITVRLSPFRGFEICYQTNPIIGPLMITD